EVVIDQPNDLKPIGDDEGVGKGLLHDGAIGRGQIHANHQDLVLALQFLQIGLQRGLRTPQNHVVDGVVLQVAEGSGKALAAREEVLIDSQDGGTSERVFFREMALESVTEVPLYGGSADAFAPAHTAAVDAVQMLPKHCLAERLAGMLAGQNAGQTLPELP